MEILGQRLARLRNEAELNQIELGRLIHRTNSYISRIESGQREPTPALVNDWLKACKSKIDLTESEYQLLLNEMQDQLAIQSKTKLVTASDLFDKPAAEFGDYTGQYYLYNFPSFGGDTIAAFEITIERKLGRFLVQAKSLHFVSHYIGELLTSEQNIQIDLNCVNIPRKLLYTFYNPPTRKINKLWGIVSGVSAVYEPMALIVLLSRKWLDEQTARQEFDRYNYTLQNAYWRILKDGQVFLDNLK